MENVFLHTEGYSDTVTLDRTARSWAAKVRRRDEFYGSGEEGSMIDGGPVPLNT
jgi:hypothetical protein